MTELVSDDLRDYYFSGQPGLVEIETIELRHPAFVDDDGNPITAIRFANDAQGFMATLEATAPVDAGTVVRFNPGRFDLVPPDSPAQGNPKASISIDNVTRLLSPHMDQAVSQSAPVEISLRSYLSDDFSMPATVVHGLSLGSSQTSLKTVKADLTFDDILNAALHDMIYQTAVWRGLVR